MMRNRGLGCFGRAKFGVNMLTNFFFYFFEKKYVNKLEVNNFYIFPN